MYCTQTVILYLILTVWFISILFRSLIFQPATEHTLSLPSPPNPGPTFCHRHPAPLLATCHPSPLITTPSTATVYPLTQRRHPTGQTRSSQSWTSTRSLGREGFGKHQICTGAGPSQAALVVRVSREPESSDLNKSIESASKNLRIWRSARRSNTCNIVHVVNINIQQSTLNKSTLYDT